MALRSPLTPARLTPEQFEAFAALPENRERRLELFNGMVCDMVSNSISAQISARLIMAIGRALTDDQIGLLTGPDGGYQISQHRLMPDLAFTSPGRADAPPGETWISIPPDIVAEVLSPTDRVSMMAAKVNVYLRAGVRVWLIDPEDRTVTVFAPAGLPTVLHADDTLDGGDVLPGFRLPLRALFPEN